MRMTSEKPISKINEEREAEQVPLLSLGQQLSQIKISNMQKDMVIQTLGQQLSMLKIEMMQLKGGGN